MSTPEDAIYSQPPEPAVLQAIGIVTIRHSEHEDVLRMLLRTFLHQDAQEARKHFAYMGPRVLREKAAELGRAIFGPGEVLDQLVALLARSEQLSKQRNTNSAATTIASINDPIRLTLSRMIQP